MKIKKIEKTAKGYISQMLCNRMEEYWKIIECDHLWTITHFGYTCRECGYSDRWDDKLHKLIKKEMK